VVLPQETVDAILAHFDLPQSRSFTRLSGWANQNYLVQTQAGTEYVLKVLILQKQELLANDIAIQRQLAGVTQTPVYCVGPNGSVLFANGEIAAVISAKIEGVHARILSHAFAFEIGKALALFHTAVHALPMPHQGWLNPLSAKRARLWESSEPVVRAAQRLINENTALLTEGLLPVGIIHGDLHEQNVLVASQAQPAVIAIMDFEEAEQNLLLLDVARTILSVCRSPQGTSLLAHNMEQLVQGYETGRAMTSLEREMLPTAIRYVIGVDVIWLVQNGFTAEAAEHLARAAALPAIGQ